MANLLHHFALAVEKHPDRVAIVDGQGLETSFAQLHARTQSLAAAWKAKGIVRGDRVLIAKPLDADLYASLAALWSLGATVVLPEPAMGLKGLRRAAETTKPKAFCSSGAFTLLKYALPEFWPMVSLRPTNGTSKFERHNIDDTDIALISFTSGTTGKPKGIPRSHAFLMAQNDAIAPLLDSQNHERDLVAFPVFTLINIAAGRTSVLPNWKMRKLSELAPADLTNWIDAQKVTRALLPPALCEKLAQHTLPVGLHTVFTGGGPVFPDVVQTLQRNNGPAVISVYGSTEAEPIAHLDASEVTTQDRQDMANGKGLLAGKPVDHIDVRIEDFEIQVSGDHVNSGYLDPAHNSENKIVDDATIWHRTGDAGMFDDLGRLWLLGRLGSEVEVEGAALYPFSIEVAAKSWLGVEQSALMVVNGEAVLVIQGSTIDEEQVRKNAKRFGVKNTQKVNRIPMDARHGSKVDRTQLLKMLNG